MESDLRLKKKEEEEEEDKEALRRKEVIYHATQETQWDHPSMLELLQQLEDDNGIRFTAYRTAAKFRKLQLFTFFDQLPLNVMTETFARHGLALPICGEGCDGRMMDVTQIVNCLTTIYCRVWDILAGNPDVVKVVVTSPNHMVHGTTPLCRSDSTATISKDNSCIPEPTRDQGQHTVGETKTLTRQPSQKKHRSCVQGVLCHSSKKTERYNEFTTKSLPVKAKPQQSNSTLNEDDAPNPPSTNHPATRQSDRSATPGEAFSPWVADGSHSRVQKLHTNLRLPDGRLFALPTCVDLALNLLLNAFDSSRNGSIRVLSFKVAILLLLDASLEDKYQYIFSLVANRDNELDESRLWLLIYECMQLPRQLGEGITSSSLEPTVRSCFKKSLASLRSGAPPESLVERGEELLPTIRMDRFYDWLKLEPQVLAWLPALYRLIVAESVVHPAKCSVCQTHPLVGLRVVKTTEQKRGSYGAKVEAWVEF
ncbi:unnamed protein product [Schistocephalus solidus]|uniref:DUF4470 domain-containing protein n=1 Tax=Schistocephalus solidus TaxID=70667 RepID=A0A183SQX7_SCHSO|nr:unnamed protein product [Schistocephalus solidus]